MIEMHEQGTDDWFAARLGKVTASRVADIIAKTKTGYSTSRDNYMAQLVCERMTNTKGESFSSAAMEWGTNQEPFARAAYEAKTGVMVEEVGFVQHPQIEWAGASPDGFVDDDGLVEIKCPNTSTHLDTIMSDAAPAKYVTQMQWQMACTGRQWCDFVSFDPRLPEQMQLFIKRVNRDEAQINQLEWEVTSFLNEIESKITQLKEKTSGI